MRTMKPFTPTPTPWAALGIWPIMGGAATPESLSQTLDFLYSTTWQLMRPEAVDNIFTATPLWYWLYHRNRILREEGGLWIGAQLLYAKNTTVGAVGPGGTIDISPTDAYTTAKFDWKWLAGSVIRLYATDHRNRGKAQIMNVMNADLQTLQYSLRDEFEREAFGDGSAFGGTAILGLQSLVKDDPTTNPAATIGNVGGIDAATNTWWRNVARQWDTTAMPVGDSDIGFNFRRVYNDCSVGNDHPSLIITEVNQYERYEASLVNLLRVVNKELGDSGFEALTYKGAAVSWSPSAPAKHAYFLNERYLQFVIEKAADFEMSDWKPIPNQLDRVAQVVVQGNLVTTNRRMQGVLFGMP